MPSAGELLRRERLKQGVDLAEVAGRTRINKQYLEAIEADNPAELPGEFFYKSFLRQYALALSLDSDTTDDILAAAVPLSEPDPLPVMSQAYERAQAGEETRWHPSTAAAVGLLVCVMAGGSLMYSWWQRTQSTVEQTSEPPDRVRERTQTPPEPEPVREPAPEAARNESTLPAATPTTAVPDAPIERPLPGEPVVEVSATEPSWIQVSSEGKTVFMGTLEANESRQFQTGADATLRTGNAGALQVRWKGQPIGPVGPIGQIRTVRFTPEGATVVAPITPKNVSTEPPPEL